MIIENIPLVFQYIIPGFLCLSLFTFMTSKRFSEKTIISFSCAISYLLLSFVSFLRVKTNIKTFPNKPIINSSFSIFFGLIFTIILGLIFTRNKFKEIMVNLFHKTPNDSIWIDVLDLNNGSNLKVYLKNKDYYVIGHHKNHEENGNDSWLALSAFGKIDKITNRNYKNEPSFFNNKNVKYVVRFSDIEHIEIF